MTDDEKLKAAGEQLRRQFNLLEEAQQQIEAQRALIQAWRRKAAFSHQTADGAVHAAADRTVADVLRQGADVVTCCADELEALLASSAEHKTETREVERPVDHRVPDVGPHTLQGAFLNGAKWWEFQSTGGTMWASDRDKAWIEAERRYPGVVETIGFEACWKTQDGFEDRHCRKPKGHDGDCAFF